ncbi:MAG TPA: carboxylating nicotinate-nucleotide diphosphorylase [Gemmatimonadetes bacterium]|nr:nicotinate-nucleotide diphosphorylase (carboxylating) [Gemmatimonadota bacterium]HAT37046.1 carboxylating nicotinate-nucleotide diphosphorylase [Gemmatimonadota bacterium]HBV06360.1 carboxylating nicotinate-nucleotide diphosphorylase [Gemmatimonadota bacterium]HCO12819.1 carboxylating nicotinate-nucleotide diphosphorylase [Gemmatimonadota bacterium]
MIDLDSFLSAALAEDLGEFGDITSEATIAEGSQATAHLVARQDGCISGLAIALRCFELVDSHVELGALVKDGDTVSAGTQLATIRGDARSILSAERLALNLLGQLSGVATATRMLVDRVRGTNAKIIDTRKTVPLLRELQKMAVVAGGGANHRMGLFDQVLIKDNHIQAVGSPAEAVRRARTRVGGEITVEVEIERLEELEEVIKAGADVVMLDNMLPSAMRAAVEIADGRVLLEASGGITLKTVREVAESGVDLISIGGITHSSPSLDVALDFST